MTPEKAYKIHMAIMLHFKVPSYDVFERNGRFNWQENVSERADFPLIKPIMKIAKNERSLVQLCAANHLYGYPNYLYDDSIARDSYEHFIKVKESLSYYLDQNLSHIELTLIKKRCTLQQYLKSDVLSDLLNGKVEYESMILLDMKIPFIQELTGFESTKYKVRMHKAKRFVNKGTLGHNHISQIDNFLENIK